MNSPQECADYKRDRCTHVVVDAGGEISAVPTDVPKQVKNCTSYIMACVSFTIVTGLMFIFKIAQFTID